MLRKCVRNFNKTGMKVKKIFIWLMRVVGLFVFLYGLLTGLFYLQFSWTEYPISWYFYPLIYLGIGLCLMMFSRSLILFLEKLFEERGLS